MNTGIPYELLVQAIFQEILDQERAQTVAVQHNITEKGRTTTHQIDVVWRFSVGGIPYMTIVQAKDWASKIKKEHVLAFHGVLEDIPGQPRGVMVTRSGFQSGAKDLANKHGIRLYLLRPAQASHITLTDISWAQFSLDRPNRQMNVTIYRPIVRMFFSFSNANAPSWLVAGTFVPRNIVLLNDAGTLRSTLRDVLASFVGEMRKAGDLAGDFTRTFDEPTYLRPRGSRKKRPIIALRAEIQISVEPQPPTPFGAPGIVEFILEDLQTGAIHRHASTI